MPKIKNIEFFYIKTECCVGPGWIVTPSNKICSYTNNDVLDKLCRINIEEFKSTRIS